MSETHFEEFVWLADVTDDAALLAWGGFWFRRDGPGTGWRLLPAKELGSLDPDRTLTVGARSQPYGDAVVTVVDDDGDVAGQAKADSVNHAWVTGLRPDTRYHYRVSVDGAEWAAGERWDWGPLDGGGRGPAPRGRSYTTTFRTNPHGEPAEPLAFAVLGDTGVGVCADTEDSERQRRIARVLDRLVADDEVRLVLTTGDTVYDGGDADVDWFGAYFQAYRYSIARVPVYPTVGNHDSEETEHSDDRRLLDGNLHIAERFAEPRGDRRATTDHGLYYRFGFGSDVEFVCIDTSEGLDEPYPRFYQHPDTQEFLRESLATGPSRPRWRIAFSHHPPYCAGPNHGNTEAMLEWVVPLLRDGGADVVFGGHEHNFQHADVDGVGYFVTGAGGKLDERTPEHFTEAHTRAWAAQGHLLHVRAGAQRMTVTPLCGLDPDGAPHPMTALAPDGTAVETPFVVDPVA